MFILLVKSVSSKHSCRNSAPTPLNSNQYRLSAPKAPQFFISIVVVPMSTFNVRHSSTRSPPLSNTICTIRSGLDICRCASRNINRLSSHCGNPDRLAPNRSMVISDLFGIVRGDRSSSTYLYSSWWSRELALARTETIDIIIKILKNS